MALSKLKPLKQIRLELPFLRSEKAHYYVGWKLSSSGFVSGTRHRIHSHTKSHTHIHIFTERSSSDPVVISSSFISKLNPAGDVIMWVESRVWIRPVGVPATAPTILCIVNRRPLSLFYEATPRFLLFFTTIEFELFLFRKTNRKPSPFCRTIQIRHFKNPRFF